MAVSQKEWLPQDNVLVRFNDDPALLHWRIVLLCVGGNECYVATPDREVQLAELEVGSKFTEVRRMREGRLPGGVRERDTYLPRHSAEGDFGADETRRLVLEAEKMAGQVAPRRRLGPRSGVVADAPGPVEEPMNRLKFFVVFKSDGSKLGDEIDPPPGAQELMIGGNHYRLFHKQGVDHFCRGADPESLEAIRSSMGLDQKKEPVEEDHDIRVLPVLFGEQSAKLCLIFRKWTSMISHFKGQGQWPMTLDNFAALDWTSCSIMSHGSRRVVFDPVTVPFTSTLQSAGHSI